PDLAAHFHCPLTQQRKKIVCIYKISRGSYTMTHQMIVRIDPELKAKVRNLAKEEGKSVSKVVRGLLEEYVKTRDIDTYIDDLWDRIGG
ncbi:MAG: CopG family transcriptional regulator, partial [Desulfovermiculus sp.]|nr:CopG family transcriptional regulator [Desulfovermiculus sp.]